MFIPGNDSFGIISLFELLSLSDIHPVFPESLFFEFFFLFFAAKYALSLAGGDFIEMFLHLCEEARGRGQIYGLVPMRAGFHAQAAYFFAGSVTHKIVAQGQNELTVGGVALAADTAGELQVQAPKSQSIGTDKMHTTFLGDAGSEFNVNAAAGHIGNDGDTAFVACLGDDLGLAGMIFGVEYLMR